MANDWAVQAVALAELRRRYGVRANPENFPTVWQDLLAWVEDAVNEINDEEGN